MADKHEPAIPLALESVVTQLGNLESVLGGHVAPRLAAVRGALIAAMAARDGGDRGRAIEHIGYAMDQLSALADEVDPAEAVLMRALAQSFRTALLRGDAAEAKQTAAVMFEKSGAVERSKKG